MKENAKSGKMNSSEIIILNNIPLSIKIVLWNQAVQQN